MSETKWTPAPWGLAYYWRGHAPCLESKKNEVIAVMGDGERHGEVAYVATSLRSAYEDAANARLISAAPELYEALSFLLLGVTNIRGIDMEDYCLPEIKVARAALTKARGEQP